MNAAASRTRSRANGGEIRIRNMPGHGCVFVLELPLATGVAPDPLPSPSPQRPQDLRGRVLQAPLPRTASA
jgi:hypothetical protein